MNTDLNERDALVRALSMMAPEEAATSTDRKLLQKVQDQVSDEPVYRGSMPRWARRFGTLFAGQRGRYPGRVPWEMRVPRQTESSAAIRGLYPWLAGQPLPARGPIFGRDVISSGLWHIDPWEHRKLDRVGDSGIFISGVIGSAKSSAAKSLVLRHIAFGRPFVVPGDLKGEWVPVAESVGGLALRLGPGMPHRLNALAMPAKPAGVDDRMWWLIVRSHWQELLEGLVTTLLKGQRQLTPTEETAIELALTEATNYHEVSGNLERLHPISLHPVVDLLRNPTESMARVIGTEVERLRDEIRDVALTLRKLTEGALQGIVDATEQNHLIDPTNAATVVDISRVQSSDVAVALVMACTQSVMELAFIYQVQQWWNVYDEAWRLMPFPALLARMNSGQRRSRGTGAGTILITHRMTDAELGGPDAQRIARDLISDCATKIIYRQRADAIAGTLGVVRLTDMVSAQLPNLPRGRAVHVVDGEPYLVDHLLPPRPVGAPQPGEYRNEWDVIETDQALSDDYRTLQGRSRDDLFGDLAA